MATNPYLKNFKKEPFRLIPNYIYLYHTDEFLVLPAFPDQMQDSLNSTFAATSAIARSAPVFSYSYSGPRKVQISLDLHRDMLDGVNLGVSNMKIDKIGDDYVDTIIKKIQAIALPRYNSGSKAVEPPMVAVRFGDEIFIKGVVEGGLSVTYKKPLIVVNDKESKYAQVSISFNVTEVDPYDADTVSLLGSFRGLTRTNNIYYD